VSALAVIACRDPFSHSLSALAVIAPDSDFKKEFELIVLKVSERERTQRVRERREGGWKGEGERER
jgi:hypothetical protein